MGIIRIEDMEFYAFHGHFKEEQIVGNKFLIDLEIETDLEPAGLSDRLDDAADYTVACRVVKQEMEKKSKLLERSHRKMRSNRRRKPSRRRKSHHWKKTTSPSLVFFPMERSSKGLGLPTSTVTSKETARVTLLQEHTLRKEVHSPLAIPTTGHSEQK
jgi:dihydroneopterin aldolase